MRYAVVIEKAVGNYSAYVPDPPGYIATGKTMSEVEFEISEAITFHIKGMIEDGLPVPPPASLVEYVEVAAQHGAAFPNAPGLRDKPQSKWS